MTFERKNSLFNEALPYLISYCGFYYRLRLKHLNLDESEFTQECRIRIWNKIELYSAKFHIGVWVKTLVSRASLNYARFVNTSRSKRFTKKKFFNSCKKHNIDVNLIPDSGCIYPSDIINFIEYFKSVWPKHLNIDQYNFVAENGFTLHKDRPNKDIIGDHQLWNSRQLARKAARDFCLENNK